MNAATPVSKSVSYDTSLCKLYDENEAAQKDYLLTVLALSHATSHLRKENMIHSYL